MAYKRLILFLSLVLFYNNIGAAVTVAVNKAGGGDYVAIQDAVNFIKVVGDAVPKFSTVGQQVVPASGKYVFGLGTRWVRDIVPGDLFSFDGLTWYEVESVDGDTLLRLTRNHELPSGGGTYTYQIISPSVVRIAPGVYPESVDLQGVRFVKFEGTAEREASVVAFYPANGLTNEILNSTPSTFRNFPSSGYITFRSMTIRNAGFGSQMANGGGPNFGMKLDNVVLDSNRGADNIYGVTIRTIEIKDSLVLGSVDGLTFDAGTKYFSIERSSIYLRWNLYMFHGGHALRAWVTLDSFIKDSNIVMEGGPGSGQSRAVSIFGTNGATVTISNTKLTALTAARALWVQGSNVVITNSKLTVSGVSGADYQIELDAGSKVNLVCTEATSILNSGGVVTTRCP